MNVVHEIALGNNVQDIEYQVHMGAVEFDVGRYEVQLVSDEGLSDILPVAPGSVVADYDEIVGDGPDADVVDYLEVHTFAVRVGSEYTEHLVGKRGRDLAFAVRELFSDVEFRHCVFLSVFYCSVLFFGASVIVNR